MMFAVNNFSQDDTDFQRIRSAVERIVQRHEFEMVSPSRWLIYSLALRRLKAEIITYDECFEVAKECGITNKEELMRHFTSFTQKWVLFVTSHLSTLKTW